MLLLGALCAEAQRVYDRGYSLTDAPVFVSKGTWMFGGNARYSLSQSSDYKFLVIDNINTYGYRLSASPVVCYMIRDNMGIGLRGGYTRSLMDIESAGVSIQDLDLSVKDYFSLGHEFSGAAIWRNYIPLGSSGRFAMVAEVLARATYGQSKIIDGHGAEITGTYQTKYSAYVGLNPGMMAFLNDHLALELNLGLLGVDISRSRQIHNQVDSGKLSSTQFNFMANLLTLGVGFAFYL